MESRTHCSFSGKGTNLKVMATCTVSELTFAGVLLASDIPDKFGLGT